MCFPHVTVSDTCVSTCLCQQILSTRHSTDSSPLGLSLFTDIDECAVNNGYCEHNCTNESGAYSCQCAPGYQLDQDGHSCTGKSHLRRKVAVPFTAAEELILNNFTQLSRAGSSDKSYKSLLWLIKPSIINEQYFFCRFFFKNILSSKISDKVCTTL